MNFLNLLKPKVHPSKNGFDLSRKHVFSSKAGQLKPCLCVETVPNDHFEIDLTSLTRSMTLNTAAFLRGKQRFDFFFVPYTQLWHPFNQFISQRDDKHSVSQLNHTYCPVINLKDLLDWLYKAYSSGTDFYNFDVHGGDSIPSMIDLLNLLGYGDFAYIYSTTLTQTEITSRNAAYASKYVNVFRLAAYQHIWYDYYRNKFYDVDVTGGLGSSNSNFFTDVSMFNFDDINCGTFANSIIQVGDPDDSTDPTNIRLMRLLQPRYCQWKKDLFTSALPGQQFGAVSSVDFNGTVNNTYVYMPELQPGSLDSVSLSASRSLLGSQGGNSSYARLIDSSVPSSFDVLSLRKAEMLQVWKQRTLRAGNMVDDSFEAHYGVKPYYEGDNNVHYLGSFSSALQVNSVEATASSSVGVNRAVGDLAATGTCLVQGNKIKFDCKDFGVIMCLASFLPESEYNANSIDKANTLHEQFDFFTPEFENIGLEAIPLREYYFSYSQAANSEMTIGFAPRYWMYKEARDKVFGEFESVGDYGKTLTPWVAPRTQVITIQSGTYLADTSNMYCNPAVLNNIFAINMNPFPNTDTFIHNVYFDIKAIRPMSELGLPQF